MFWLYGIKENFVSFSQKKSKARLVTLKKSQCPAIFYTAKKWLPRCILHRPRYTVTFSSPLMNDDQIKKNAPLYSRYIALSKVTEE